MREQHTSAFGKSLNLGPKKQPEEWKFSGRTTKCLNWYSTTSTYPIMVLQQNPQISLKIFIRNWTASLPTQKAKTFVWWVISSQNSDNLTKRSVLFSRSGEVREKPMANVYVNSWWRRTWSPVIPSLNIEHVTITFQQKKGSTTIYNQIENNILRKLRKRSMTKVKSQNKDHIDSDHRLVATTVLKKMDFQRGKKGETRADTPPS